MLLKNNQYRAFVLRIFYRQDHYTCVMFHGVIEPCDGLESCGSKSPCKQNHFSFKLLEFTTDLFWKKANRTNTSFSLVTLLPLWKVYLVFTSAFLDVKGCRSYFLRYFFKNKSFFILPIQKKLSKGVLNHGYRELSVKNLLKRPWLWQFMVIMEINVWKDESLGKFFCF